MDRLVDEPALQMPRDLGIELPYNVEHALSHALDVQPFTRTPTIWFLMQHLDPDGLRKSQP